MARRWRSHLNSRASVASSFFAQEEKFGDYRLHIEFMLPEEGDGNSGIFFGPLYELQILNSAEKESPQADRLRCDLSNPRTRRERRTGSGRVANGRFGVSEQRRFDARGYMTERNAAHVTVRLNGKLIHDDFKLSLRRNKYAAFPEEPLSPIVLQEHGSPVKFRNIWLVNKAVTKEPRKKKWPPCL